MLCKHVDAYGWCLKSGIISNYEGSHDIPMECEFAGDVQQCFDNLVELNGRGIPWKAYAELRMKQTNPNALKFCETLEKEAKAMEQTSKPKKGRR